MSLIDDDDIRKVSNTFFDIVNIRTGEIGVTREMKTTEYCAAICATNMNMWEPLL